MSETSLSGIQRRAAGNRAHNRMVLQKLVAFSVLMVVVPLGTFYAVRSLFTPGSPDSQYADAWSGFSAVLAVNVVIGLYVLSAWKEDDQKEVAPPVGRFAKKEQ
ncbi:Vacuolar ATPase assembly integral membrane protein VMA21 [Phytophthora megakarya]|uniref:Vacuolar ATPase assembly integral membrane protein VMA21 homolog n=1 Tax=Phytophthora megakarya TaxID=4795 RepID=A0A225WW80_9STRA|nr:Vacuolar ATPase assembly integral membrane protein VMA21 [Phytophthora megakarya]